MSKLKGKWAKLNIQRHVPTGTVDGVNKTFTLSFSPNELISFTLNGRPLKLTTDFTIAGNTITMVDAPAFGQELFAEYY